jgi:hypothetical protein
MDRDKIISALLQIRDLTGGCLADLDDSTKSKRPAKKLPASSHTSKPIDIDFGIPLRPFVKQYAKGLSGPKKFVLLLSRLAKGDVKKEVGIEEIKKHWNKMKAKSLLGLDFNTFYPTRAGENDWVEAKEKGIYNLRPSWKEIFRNANA